MVTPPDPRLAKELQQIMTPATAAKPPAAVAAVAEKDYALVGKPTISREIFFEALAHRVSPVVVDMTTKKISQDRADAAYSIILSYGMDPNVALAQFMHESGMGVAGVAAEAKNWGNLRAGPRQHESKGGFAYYLTWYDSLEDYCWTLTEGGLYYPDVKTVSQMTPKYAPSADSNDPTQYAKAVNRQAAIWEALTERG